MQTGRYDHEYGYVLEGKNSKQKKTKFSRKKYNHLFRYHYLLARTEDEVAEWLRRWTANPLGSARVGSNPILVALVLWCNG